MPVTLRSDRPTTSLPTGSFRLWSTLVHVVALAMALAPPAVAEETQSSSSVERPPEEAESPESVDVPEAQSPNLVERLPGTAYPEWRTRGLRGGSLWLSGSMHGMPWPFYPRTGIGLSGYVWLDTSYQTIERGNNNQPDSKYLLNQGRGVLRASPTYSLDNWYVQGQLELVANKDQAVPQPAVADVDDLWIRIGQWRTWDLQVGRFEAFEVYHFGMGMDLNTLERQGASDQQRTPPDVYGLQTTVYRQSGVGNFAFHYYLGNSLRLELLGQLGFDSVAAINTYGGRPALIVDLGSLKLKVAADTRKQFPINNSSKESRWDRGLHGAVQVVLDPIIEFGANVALGYVDHYNPQNVTDPNATVGDYDTAGSVTTWSLGGFANLRLAEDLLAGTGVNYTHEDDQQSGHFTNLQAFGAVQYVVRKQLFVKLVGAYAKAYIAQGGKPSWENSMFSARVRLMYLF